MDFIEWLRAALANATEVLKDDIQMVIVLDKIEENKNDIGLEEFIEGDGVCLIEWPSFITHLIPEDTISVKISNLGDDERKFEFESDSDLYEEIFKMLGEKYD